VTDDGNSKLIKWHWKTKQGKASLVWDEAQHIAGKNADYHRADLFNAIESGNFPEWELNAQIIDEDQALAFGFDVLDPTKIIPEELAPLHPLGVMRLDVNPVNYFAETEQIMFQPGHIVRGIDFTEDPLLQGRIFSYLDTQINRHGGPNFEQLPINRPIGPVRNNNRDGAAQTFIHRNKAPYTPNTLNKGLPMQANQAQGRGFFTAPGRQVTGSLLRKRASTFADHWSQPRLFYNSLTPVEQQFLINAMRFETSMLSESVQVNVLEQLNKISHDVAVRVGTALGLEAPAADDTYYHDNTTTGITIFGEKLPSIATLAVGVLASTASPDSLSQAAAIKEAFAAEGVTVTVVAETLTNGVDATYSGADAINFDGLIIAEGAQSLVTSSSRKSSPLYPPGRPAQILADSYYWGKPVGFVGEAKAALGTAGTEEGAGVYAVAGVQQIVDEFKDGLAIFKFTDRFAMDE
jgi:catalase